MAPPTPECSCGGTKRHKPGCAKYMGKTKTSRRHPGGRDPAKLCGYCRKPKSAHSPTCKRVTRGTGTAGTSPKAARKPGTDPTNGGDPIATIRGALVALEAELKGARAVKAAFEAAFGPGGTR